MSNLASTFLRKLLRREKVFSITNYNLGKNILERRIKRTKLNSYPLEVILGLTEKCNLRCIFCERGPNSQYKNIDFLTFKRVVAEIGPYTRILNLTGWGENLVHPDFHRMFDYITEEVSNELKLLLITNGTIMDETLMRKFLKNLDILTISLNSSKEEVFEQLMPNARFEEVIKNIKKLVKLKEEINSEKPVLHASFVGMRQNIEELPDFVRFTNELGFDAVGFNYLMICAAHHFDYSLFFRQDITNDMICKAKEIADDLGIGFRLPPSFKTKLGCKDESYTNEKCFFPWTFSTISSDGKVEPCCFWDDTVMGNINEVSFKEIWNGEKYRNLREKVNSQDPPKPCKNCRARIPESVDSISYHLQRSFKKTKQCQDILKKLGLVADII